MWRYTGRVAIFTRNGGRWGCTQDYFETLLPSLAARGLDVIYSKPVYRWVP